MGLHTEIGEVGNPIEQTIWRLEAAVFYLVHIPR
jgi:hypothetical protein